MDNNGIKDINKYKFMFFSDYNTYIQKNKLN